MKCRSLSPLHFLLRSAKRLYPVHVYLLALTGTILPSTSSYISLYSLIRDGTPCILLQADASITVIYKTKSGDDRVSLILYICLEWFRLPAFLNTINATVFCVF
jgi:hypothetical protein